MFVHLEFHGSHRIERSFAFSILATYFADTWYNSEYAGIYRGNVKIDSANGARGRAKLARWHRAKGAHFSSTRRAVYVEGGGGGTAKERRKEGRRAH